MFFGDALRIYRQLTAYSMIEPSVRSACAILIMRSAVVIIMAQSVPDCAVVVRSAFSETRSHSRTKTTHSIVQLFQRNDDFLAAA